VSETSGVSKSAFAGASCGANGGHYFLPCLRLYTQKPAKLKSWSSEWKRILQRCQIDRGGFYTIPILESSKARALPPSAESCGALANF
jgi:hypothetical protein